MSLIATLLSGTKPILDGTATVFRVEEYRDRPKKREKKPYIKPEHNMVFTERKNRAAVLAAIRQKPRNTTEIIEQVGLSRSAVHNLTKTLVENGEVRLNKDIWPWIYEPIHKGKG